MDIKISPTRRHSCGAVIRTGAIALMAILISCAGIHGADTIELPFDYFYGRWTPGHFLDGRVALTDADPQGRTDYSYTSDRIQVGLDDVPEYLVVSQQSDYALRTPTLYLYHRPAPNWQVGIDNLCYHESYGLILHCALALCLSCTDTV
jgi:hypothetical protein